MTARLVLDDLVWALTWPLRRLLRLWDDWQDRSPEWADAVTDDWESSEDE